MKYKKWSLKEKLEILACSEEIGVVETCRKYSVSTGTFYSWKKKFDHKGEAMTTPKMVIATKPPLFSVFSALLISLTP